MGLKSGDTRLLEVEAKMRLNITKLVDLLNKRSVVRVSEELDR